MGRKSKDHLTAAAGCVARSWTQEFATTAVALLIPRVDCRAMVAMRSRSSGKTGTGNEFRVPNVFSGVDIVGDRPSFPRPEPLSVDSGPRRAPMCVRGCG